MTPERIDLLLDEALATGAVPADATAEERAEVEELLRAAGNLRISRATVEREAAETMPVARARFERQLASTQKAGPVARPRRTGAASLFGWLFVAHRAMGTAVSAAGIAIIAAVAILVSQNAFNGVDTAAAQVLTPGDYVQVGGVVAHAEGTGDGHTVRVASEFGEVEVALSDVTSVVDDAAKNDPTSIKKGDTVLVSGLVQKDRTIAAQTLAVSAAEAPPPKRPPIKELKVFRPGLEGRVVFLSLGEDGKRARAVIQVRDELLLVRISDRSLKVLLQGGRSPLGVFVVVGEEPGLPPGMFSLTLAASPGPAPEPGSEEGATTTASVTGERSATRPPAKATPTPPSGGETRTPVALKFTGFKAIVLGRQDNLLQVETAKGVATVIIRLDTRLVIAGSGLARESLTGAASIVGHEVTVSGSLVEGRVYADLIVFGPKVR